MINRKKLEDIGGKALLWTGTNAACLQGAYHALQNADSGPAYAATSLALAGGAGVLNHYVIPAVSARMQKHRRLLQAGIMSLGLAGLTIAGPLYTNSEGGDDPSPEGHTEQVVATHQPPGPLRTNTQGGNDTISKGTETLDSRLEGVPIHVSTGPLNGTEFSGLFSAYTGIAGTVPEQAEMNFKEQLEELWQKKRAQSENGLVDKLYEERVTQFSPTDTISVTNYLQRIEESITTVSSHLDWSLVAQKKSLSGEKTELLQDMTQSITPQDLLSYAMTEIMPSHNGSRNLEVLSLLLNNAGTDFIELLPSMGDDLLSFGPYQVTKYTVNHDGTGGASMLNDALPKEHRIPDELTGLQDGDHHRTALLFMVNNLADALRQVEDIQELREQWRDHKDDLILYCATAHHQPQTAQQAFSYWVDSGMQHGYVRSCPASILSYARKTRSNVEALNSYLGHVGPFRKVRESDNETLFAYQVRQGEHPAEIIRTFDRSDNARKDRYTELSENLFTQETYKRILDPETMQYTGNDINPGEQVYLKAPKR